MWKCRKSCGEEERKRERDEGKRGQGNSDWKRGGAEKAIDMTLLSRSKLVATSFHFLERHVTRKQVKPECRRPQRRMGPADIAAATRISLGRAQCVQYYLVKLEARPHRSREANLCRGDPRRNCCAIEMQRHAGQSPLCMPDPARSLVLSLLYIRHRPGEVVQPPARKRVSRCADRSSRPVDPHATSAGTRSTCRSRMICGSISLEVPDSDTARSLPGGTCCSRRVDPNGLAVLPTT